MPSSYPYSVLNGQKGDKTTARDWPGRTQGSATQSGNRISIRDGSDQSIGSAEISKNRTTFRDASGRTIQTATTKGERTTFRSSNGSSLPTASQSRNSTTFRDSSGRQLDQHPTVELERPFGTAQGVRRYQLAATDNEWLEALQTISLQSRKIALIYLKAQRKSEPKVQRRYQSVPRVPSIRLLLLQSETIWLLNQ